MLISEHIDHLRHEGAQLGAAISPDLLDEPVPYCPGWNLRELVQHTGRVHRWAASVVKDRREIPVRSADIAGPMPDDPELQAWYDEGLEALLGALSSASEGDAFWSFGPATSPLAFWARRQALETAIHRVDAERAAGRTEAPVDAALSLDGVAEILDVFIVPRKTLKADPPRTLHIHCTDAAGEWLVELGPEGTTVRPEHAKGDAAVRATASDLFLLVWNRRDLDGLEVFGDGSLLAHWRDTVRIR